ncbi:MAG: antitoxin [Kiritimatiellae bacterium]|nr:antitoxin [Kiritimatiellia bacterium]
MNTKLTLRMDTKMVRKAKAEARRRGKSVSRMVADFFDALGRTHGKTQSLPPTTRSLVGLLKGRSVSEKDYRQHLREKYR